MSVSLLLRTDEEFQFDWSTRTISGKAIARWIRYNGEDDMVWVQGPNLGADGKPGLVQRQEYIHLADVPHDVLLKLEDATHAEIRRWQQALAPINKAILEKMP